MIRNTDITRRLHDDRGGTVTRVLLVIVGVLITLIGLALGLCSVLLVAEGDIGVLGLLGFLPFTLSSLVGGIFIIVTQVSEKRADNAPAASLEAERVVSTQQLSGPAEHERTSPPAKASEPASPTKDAGPTGDVAHLVLRSTDLFATLRDLVRHATGGTSDKRHLASMLEAAGIMEWSDAPHCEGGLLARNKHYWIRLGTDGLTDAQYDTLVMAEAALSINQDLPSLRSLPLDSLEAQEAKLKLLREMCDQDIERPKLTEEGLRVAYGTTDESASTGEWVIRSIISNMAECVRTPFRVVYDLRVNSAEGLVVLGVEIPRPRCMAIFTSDVSHQASLARAYAFRLAVLLATHAFGASEIVRRVVVNGHEHDADDTLVSIDMDRTNIEIMRVVAGGLAIESGFPADGRIRSDFVTDWFAPVDPFVALDDPQALPAHARIFPELDRRKAPEAIVRTCWAQRICDLGINENASRIAAWESVRTNLGSSTEQAVSALVAARNETTDITVAEACNRTAQALVEGDLDLDNLSAIAALFIDGSALDRAVERAVRMLDDSEGNANPEAAAQLLEAALAPIEDMGAYLDDEDTVYRYFGSVSERITHNLNVNEGGREIRLVPDAYFNAHSNASIALGMMGEEERALAHADTCLRLAPTSTYATMRKVRILESQSRIFEAADIIVEALRHAVTPRDAAICHYRLAYMEWKLGREDVAAACYQRSLSWDTEMSSQAREELDDLLSSNPRIERPTDEQADALLAREGIPLGCVKTDGERTLASAVACMDDGVLFTARPLMAVLFSTYGDDVVMGVYRSLKVSS